MLPEFIFHPVPDNYLLRSDDVKYITGILTKPDQYMGEDTGIKLEAISESDLKTYNFQTLRHYRYMPDSEIRFVIPVLSEQSGEKYYLKCTIRDRIPYTPYPLIAYYSQQEYGGVTLDPEKKTFIDPAENMGDILLDLWRIK